MVPWPGSAKIQEKEDAKNSKESEKELQTLKEKKSYFKFFSNKVSNSNKQMKIAKENIFNLKKELKKNRSVI